MIICRSPQYRRNSIAPRTKPWGMPHTMVLGEEERRKLRA